MGACQRGAQRPRTARRVLHGQLRVSDAARGERNVWKRGVPLSADARASAVRLSDAALSRGVGTPQAALRGDKAAATALNEPLKTLHQRLFLQVTGHAQHDKEVQPLASPAFLALRSG
eukprot:1682464-Pleurochrysis_carterae.AAC.5